MPEEYQQNSIEDKEKEGAEEGEPLQAAITAMKELRRRVAQFRNLATLDLNQLDRILAEVEAGEVGGLTWPTTLDVYGSEWWMHKAEKQKRVLQDSLREN